MRKIIVYTLLPLFFSLNTVSSVKGAAWKVYTSWPFNEEEAERRQKKTAKALNIPVDREIELGDGVKMALVLIPAGEFVMGSGGEDAHRSADQTPSHRVRITEPFYISRYEVRQEEWQAIMGENPSHYKGTGRPVENISWSHCQDFLGKLNARIPGGGFRLPTEAEWEYACRAGTETRFSCGDDPGYKTLEDYAVCGRKFSGVSGLKDATEAVGQRKPNSWGLCDMHGNVWEWSQDWYDRKYYSQSPFEDPAGPESGRWKVLRGGSWMSKPEACSSDFREFLNPSYAVDFNGGLRVVGNIRRAGE